MMAAIVDIPANFGIRSSKRPEALAELPESAKG
jgi:hypothetical protein